MDNLTMLDFQRLKNDRNFRYYPLFKLGQGANGLVYAAITEDTAEHVEKGNSMHNWSSRIVAVKTRIQYDRDLKREIEVLHEIKMHSPPGSIPFPTLLDYDTLEGKWFVMNAQILATNLLQFPRFTVTRNYFPAGLLAQFFSRVGEAIRFLHNTIEIAHGDLGLHNIMVSPRHTSRFSLPEFVIIDPVGLLVVQNQYKMNDVFMFCSICTWFFSEADRADEWTTAAQAP
jgi:tRNA A-37 threonylcarbamoyl transferase component Bud32